jgi:hypothetical protein
LIAVAERAKEEKDLLALTHETITSVTKVRHFFFLYFFSRSTWADCGGGGAQALDAAPYSFNTAVADLMKLSNKITTRTTHTTTLGYVIAHG